MNSTPAPPRTEPSSVSLERYLRAVHYLAGAQIYLRGNVLLREPLRAEHVKDRLLGHWGTCPGINLVYAHLNRVILRDDLDAMLITGPGHGAPANLANLYLEGSLREFYPELTHDIAGVETFVREFSWPGGVPSHLYPGIPGTIHEGGELGYALATAFGAAFDNPDLLVTCIVGDGEAETGPTAAAWHGTKFLDPAESGAVLPILHVNGYKISNPTISGSMSDDELRALFTGYGWHPRFVKGNDLSASMAAGMDWALGEIRGIQRAARSGEPIAQPRWPMLVLRSPKGWTGVKELDGKPVEGSFRAHQVPVGDVKKMPSICGSWKIGCARIDPKNSSMNTAHRRRTFLPVVHGPSGEWAATRTPSEVGCAGRCTVRCSRNARSKFAERNVVSQRKDQSTSSQNISPKSSCRIRATSAYSPPTN
jgi:xylulose-5-phosphate/fructose-6-phosphate phosphoketolase